MKQDAKVEYTKKLMEQALKNQHFEKEIIRSMDGLLAANKLKHATRTISYAFGKTANKLFNSYLENLRKGVDDIQLLINYRSFKQCRDYYTEERKLIEDSITEFHNYMLTYGNFINTMLGFERPEEQM